MSRPTIASTLRPLFHPRPQPIASTSSLVSQSQFSTSSPLSASRSKQNAKRKKTKVLQLRQNRQAEDSNPPDPVLGQFVSSSRQGITNSGGESVSVGGTGNKWEGCRLQRTLLTPEMVYSAPLVQGDRQNYIHGLSPSDKNLLFGGLPYTTLSLASTTPASNSENGIIEQENQVESIRRILDLRNASRSGIEVVNRQRIVEEFGRKRVLRQQDGGEGEGVWGYEGEPQSGGSEVQAALLTSKIRNLHSHLLQNPRDTHNKRPLRTLVHQRAKILKYLKRTQPGVYEVVLADLGLEKRAVEGELVV